MLEVAYPHPPRQRCLDACDRKQPNSRRELGPPDACDRKRPNLHIPVIMEIARASYGTLFG